ncbi:hypothetical protein GL2_33400 [Microbulbifer sp. GL-2]|nr:hypothetical protein GL2_33400 [Microbulbifer sp. GL-2]
MPSHGRLKGLSRQQINMAIQRMSAFLQAASSYKDLHTEVFGETFLIKVPDGHIIRVSSAD